MTSAGGEIPSGIGHVDARWLSAVLRADVSDVRAERIAVDSGFSSLLYRLHVTGGAGVPSSVIVKLPAESEARGAMEMMGGYARELAFYQHVAGRAPLGTPDVYAARMSATSADFVLVLEDLRDWDNTDHLAGLSLSQARMCIAQLAGMHAWSMNPANAPILQAFPSLNTPVMREILPAVFAQGWTVYCEKSSVGVPSAVTRYAERFAEHAVTALRALTERSMLLHGDIRADNMFFAGDQLKIVDFQLTSGGAGAADIGYLVSQGLPTEVRRGHDEALVREYVERLGELGVADYSFDDAWRHYRFAVAYLMLLPVIILVSWHGLPERSRALCMKLTERAVAAIDDIGALEVFE